MALDTAIPAGIGVITACDSFFFPGFQLLFHSLHGIPITLFDLGLSAAQRDWCRERAIPVQQIPLVMPATVNGWQSWNKPFYLEQTPYERTLWLDSDCVVRGSLLPLFDQLLSKPIILHHWSYHYPTLNDNRLYERLPTKSRFAGRRLVNAGVMGIAKNRDLSASWFREWRGLVAQAAQDADLRNWIVCWDEGALIWALEATASIEDVVSDHQTWNRFASHAGWKENGGLAALLRAKTDDVVWHLSGQPKVWATPCSPSEWMFEKHALAPFDFRQYPHIWKMPDWTVDKRHIYWMYDILASGNIRTALEIGSLYGASSTAFVEAINHGALQHATFCDTTVTPELEEALQQCVFPDRVHMFEGRAADLLRSGASFDYVFVDGDHSFEAVHEELDLILQMRPRVIMAHDTSATGSGFAVCEGPTYLKHRLQTLGWYCLEDALPREHERTHRGMFFATTDPVLFSIARASMASRCDILLAQMQEPYAASHSPPAKNWRQLLREAWTILQHKLRVKKWLW